MCDQSDGTTDHRAMTIDRERKLRQSQSGKFLNSFISLVTEQQKTKANETNNQKIAPFISQADHGSIPIVYIHII